MRIVSIIVMVIGAALLLSGCGSADRRMLKAEEAFGTDGPIRHLFHSTLYYPREISLQFDGYILGVEKASKDKILTGPLKTFDRPEAGITGTNNAASHLNDGTIMFVSHVLRQRPSFGLNEKCALHNVYAGIPPTRESGAPLVHFCDGISATIVPPHEGYHRSWEAMSRLKEAVTSDLNTNKYTHLVVVTMGWNTDQIEAVRNINSIVGNLLLSAPRGQKPIVPLVIGVTWPSMWVYSFADPIVKFASFPTKANDADEVGLTWLGVLLHQTLPTAKAESLKQKDIPLLIVGHSFGSRASMVGACVGPVIYEHQPVTALKSLDYVINFQGAFLTSQLVEPGSNELYFAKGCAHAKNIVLTSSKSDTANNIPSYIPGWGYYAGDDRSFRKYCGGLPSRFPVQCAAARLDGSVNVPQHALSNILLINADALITEEAFGSGGGAHSDIYRLEHGKLINELLIRRPLPSR